MLLKEPPQKPNINQRLFVAMSISDIPVTLPFRVDTGADITLTISHCATHPTDRY